MQPNQDMPKRALRDLWIGYYIGLDFTLQEVADRVKCSPTTVMKRKKIIEAGQQKEQVA